MARFLPLALLIPLSAFGFEAVANAHHHALVDAASYLNKSEHVQQDNIIASMKDSDRAVQSMPIVVTEDNFPQAYSNLRFDAIIKQAGGINKFLDIVKLF